MITTQAYAVASSLEELAKQMVGLQEQLDVKGFGNFQFSNVTVIQWSASTYYDTSRKTEASCKNATRFLQTITGSKGSEKSGFDTEKLAGISKPSGPMTDKVPRSPCMSDQASAVRAAIQSICKYTGCSPYTWDANEWEKIAEAARSV